MRILFIAPPKYRFSGVSMWFGYGPLYLAAVLKGHHDVRYYNADAPSVEEKGRRDYSETSYEVKARSHAEYVAALSDLTHPVWKEVEQVITDFQPDVIGLSTMTPAYPAALVIARLARRISDAVILMGGVHASLLPEEVIRTGLVDYVVRGEAEETLPMLLRRLEKRLEPLDIKGLTFMRDGKVIHTPDQGYIDDLNALPPPAMDALMFPERFSEASFATVMGGRGCPHHCTYCANHVLWKKYRMRSAEKIFEDFQRVRQKHNGDIYFLDDNFMVFPKTLFSVCEMIATKAPGSIWKCQSRIDTLTDEKIIACKDAGCWNIGLGIESGSDRMLKLINKGVTSKQGFAACEQLLRHGIQVQTNFMFGFPEETWEDLQLTKEAIRTIPANNLVVSKLIPLPGTDIFQDIKASGVIKESTPLYEHFDLYSDYYHFPRHIPREQFAEFTQEVFELVDERNKLIRMGPPPSADRPHMPTDVQRAAAQQV